MGTSRTNQRGEQGLEARIVLSKITNTIMALGQQGMTPDDLHAIRASEKIAKGVVRYVRRRTTPRHEIDTTLLKILGGEHLFFGPTDWEIFFNIKLDHLLLPDLTRLYNIIFKSPYPFGEREITRDHYFFYCLPTGLTILEWTKITVLGETLEFLDQEDDGFQGRDYVEKTTPRWNWYLAHLGVIPGSLNKMWEEQISVLPSNHFVPLACEYALLPLLFYLKTGKESIFGSLNYGRFADTYGSSGDIQHIAMRFGKYNNFTIFPMNEDPFEETGILACWNLTA